MKYLLIIAKKIELLSQVLNFLLKFFLFKSKLISYYKLFLLLIITSTSFYNCFSLLKPPPITFTQSQTVAEKQMLGENRELEPDGWLISSIKTSTVGPIEWRKEFIEEFGDPIEAEEFRKLLKILFHTAPEIKNLKQLHFVGENLKGKLTILETKKDPKFIKFYRTEEKKKKAIELIDLVNKTRDRLNEILIKNKKRDNVSSNYTQTVEVGEYYEEKLGIWILKE